MRTELPVKYHEGELVRHPKCPEWGVGRVTKIGPNSEVSVAFARGGHKTLRMDSVPFTLQKLERTRDALIEYHREFLSLARRPYAGVRAPGRTKHRRVAHCYSCGSALDSATDIECVACGWIVCWCGACGCGYSERGIV